MTYLGDAWLWLAPAVGFLVHLTVGRQNAGRVARQWEALPTALDPQRLGQIRSSVECDSDSLQIALDSARQALSEADVREFGRQLDIARAIVEDAIPDRVRRLEALALVARMAGAIERLPALSPSAYRLYRLRALAGLAYPLHDLLFGSAARLLLRMRVLKAALASVHRLLSRCRSALERLPAAQPDWQLFEAIVDDFRTLDREHLEAASACLVSSRIQPRIQIVAQRAR